MTVELLDAAHTNLLAGTFLEEAKRGRLHSAATGADYAVLVSLPRDYATTDRACGVVIVLDGGLYFPAIANFVRMSAMERAVEDMIVVGVSTDANAGVHMLQRMRDYLPDNAPPDMRAAILSDAFKSAVLSLGATEAQWDAVIARGMMGGVDDFLRFLETELLPWLEANFRIDRSRLGIAGHSAGGAMVAYALLKGSSFTRYLGASFATMWFGDTLNDLEAAFIASPDKRPLQFYECQGELESKPPVEEMRAMYETMMAQAGNLLGRLSAPDPARLSVERYVVPGAGHMGSGQEGLSAGIRYLFPALPVEPAA